MRATEIEGDAIFQESTSREFLDINAHDMFIKKDEDVMYSGDELFGGFGLTPTYEAIYFIPQKYFIDLGFEPIEGDIISDEQGTIFEISKTDGKTASQLSIKIGDMTLSRRVYLKQYSFDYKDKFDSVLLDDIEDEFTSEDLALLNDALESNIDDLDIISESDNVLFDGWN